MATARQLKVIENLESSVKALEHEGIPYLERTATMICDRAGESLYAIRPMIQAARKNGDRELLARFLGVFGKCVSLPKCLEGVYEDVEGPLPPNVLPPTAREREAQRADFAPHDGKSSRLVLDQIIEILEPLPRSEQERVISTASTYYGVGT